MKIHFTQRHTGRTQEIHFYHFNSFPLTKREMDKDWGQPNSLKYRFIYFKPCGEGGRLKIVAISWSIHLPGHIPDKGLRKPQGSGESSGLLWLSATSTPSSVCGPCWRQESRAMTTRTLCLLLPGPSPALPQEQALPRLAGPAWGHLSLPLHRTAVSPDERRLPTLPDSTTFYYLSSSGEVLLNVYLLPNPQCPGGKYVTTGSLKRPNL